MAAATVSRTEQHSCGDLKLYVVTFSSLADTNTYASGLGSNVVGYWANCEYAESSGSDGVNVANSSGTFTFSLSTTNTAAKLFILATG
jgi:hypothetical protein